jgi:hypothetical protein
MNKDEFLALPDADKWQIFINNTKAFDKLVKHVRSLEMRLKALEYDYTPYTGKPSDDKSVNDLMNLFGIKK